MIIINNRDKVEWQAEMTVFDLLTKMKYSFHLVTVSVNNQYVPPEDYEEHPVPDDAQVSVFHLAHGG